MSDWLYLKVLELLQNIEEANFSEGKASFQYILTTTTPPTELLASSPYLILELKPDDEETLLFGKRFNVSAQNLIDV